ncbi:MAG: hypothetical protein ACREBG_19110 [Pyrinomonadaceae bacterium]
MDAAPDEELPARMLRLRPDSHRRFQGYRGPLQPKDIADRWAACHDALVTKQASYSLGAAK